MSKRSLRIGDNAYLANCEDWSNSYYPCKVIKVRDDNTYDLYEPSINKTHYGVPRDAIVDQIEFDANR